MKDFLFISALEEEIGSDSVLGRNVLFSGIGKINACLAVFKAKELGYRKIINIGSCGSMNHEVGKVLKIGKVFQDIDCSPLSEYGTTYLENVSEILFSESSYSCFSTDYFYDHNQQEKYSKDYLSKISECSVFDMECYALVKTCKSLDIKFESYKWVSDDGNSENWKDNCKIGLENFKKYFLSNES